MLLMYILYVSNVDNQKPNLTINVPTLSSPDLSAHTVRVKRKKKKGGGTSAPARLLTIVIKDSLKAPRLVCLLATMLTTRQKLVQRKEASAHMDSQMEDVGLSILQGQLQVS